MRAVFSLMGDQEGQTAVRNLHRYCATRGLLFSHVGWIFFKPNYPKLHLIERDDLEDDPGLLTRFVDASTGQLTASRA